MKSGPVKAYQALLKKGILKPDDAQAFAAEKLEKLFLSMNGYVPQSARVGWLDRLIRGKPNKTTPRGLYFYGGPGRGKSMLMDLFFTTTSLEKKQRVHYHMFMKEVHDRINNFRQAAKLDKVASGSDPIIALSRIISRRAWLLCFDEFHVTDIADAMILGRLFESLFDSGVIVVATSNRAPDDLYEGGLQRGRFLPFIELFKKNLDVLPIDSGIDHRLEQIRMMKVYLMPLSSFTDSELEQGFKKLALGAKIKQKTLNVYGRELKVTRTVKGVAFFSFSQLCESPLGAADYLAIAGFFHTIFVSRIPILKPERRDSAKRFVTLIDAMYEQKVNLICSAEAEPNRLYELGDGAFEFERTSSRLIEMQSEDYISTPHLKTVK